MQVIEGTENGAKHRVGQEDGKWGPVSVVESHKSRRFELANRIRPVPFCSHAWVQRGEEIHAHGENDQCVREPEQKPKPPVDATCIFKNEYVENRKGPAVKDVSKQTIEARAVAVVSDDRTEQVRQVHARQAEPLTQGQHRRQRYSRDESGENRTPP